MKEIVISMSFSFDGGTGYSYGILDHEIVPGSEELNNAIVNAPDWEPSPSGGALQFQRPMRGDLRTIPGPVALAAGVPPTASIEDYGKTVYFQWSCPVE